MELNFIGEFGILSKLNNNISPLPSPLCFSFVHQASVRDNAVPSQPHASSNTVVEPDMTGKVVMAPMYKET